MHYTTWLLVLALTSFNISAQTQSPSTSVPRLQWPKTTGVTKYRLQIASDERFRDVLVDKLVHGQDYVPTFLAAGEYFWRVAPSQYETGPFQQVSSFRIGSGDSTISSKPITPKIYSGWTTAIGPVNRLALSLSARSKEILAVDSKGGIYAIDPDRGIAKWIVRWSPNPSRFDSTNSFVPVSVNTNAECLVVFGIEKGLRAVAAQTGRTVWTTSLSTNAIAAIASDTFSPPLLYVIDANNELLIVDALRGPVRKRLKLERQPVAPPFLLSGNGIFIPAKQHIIEFRSLDGELLRTIDAEAEITTSPLMLTSARGISLVVGTQRGVAQFAGTSFQPLGHIAFEENDYPVGSLIVVDLNGDGVRDVVATTKDRKLVAVDAAAGKVLWSKPNAGGMSPILADTDDNGRDDLLMVDGRGFLLGLSGVDGDVVWQSDTTVPGSRINQFVAVKTSDGRLLLVGADATGLRAVEITKSSMQQVAR